MPRRFRGRSSSRRVAVDGTLSPGVGARDLIELLAPSSIDDSALVGDDDELHSVARAEFHQDPGDVRLGGEWTEVKRLGDFGVGQARRDEAEDFSLAVRELVQPVVVGLGYRLRCCDVGIDQPTGDTGGQQCFAAGPAVGRPFRSGTR